MSKPDFLTLEAMPGHPELRQINGAWMDREQYDTEGWFLTTIPGGDLPYWMARLGGLRAYGRLCHQRREQRRAAWQERDAEEDSFREYVNALDDAKPQGRP